MYWLGLGIIKDASRVPALSSTELCVNYFTSLQYILLCVCYIMNVLNIFMLLACDYGSRVRDDTLSLYMWLL